MAYTCVSYNLYSFLKCAKTNFHMVAPRSALADRSNRPTASADGSAKASGTYVQESSSVDVHVAVVGPGRLICTASRYSLFLLRTYSCVNAVQTI